MSTRLFPASERGHFNYGWLDTSHSFSFAQFYDPNLMGFGKLRVVNDDVIAPGAGFGRHPHDNMEIITIPISGAVAHEDSAGGQGIVGASEIQVMTAGTGVTHSEFNASESEPLSLFQIWIEPANAQLPPHYDQKSFDQAGRLGKFQLLVSPDGREDSLTIHQQAFILRGDFAVDNEISYSVRSREHGIFLMVIEGEIQVGQHCLRRRDALGITRVSSFKGTAVKASQLLLIEVPME